MTESKSTFFSLAMLAFLIACVVSINIPVLQEIIEPWHEDGTYSHGYLLLLIAGYVFWRNREFFSYPATKVNKIAVLTFVYLCVTWLAARVMGIEVIYRAIMPFFLLNLFYFVLTPKAANRFIFPCLLLLYAIPFWGLLSNVLQIVSAEAVTFIVQSMGINVFLDGIFITIPAGTFEVAGGCSGIRYLLVTLTLSSIYSHFYYNKMSSKIKLTLLAIALSLVTNWIRIVILVLIGHYTDMQHEMLADHNNLGWVIFFILMIPLRLYADKLEKNERNSEVTTAKISYNKGPLTVNAAIVASVCVIAMSLMGSLLSSKITEINEKADDVRMIAVSDTWTATEYQTNFKPIFIDATGGDVTYVNEETQKHLQLSIYRYTDKVDQADLTDYRNKPIPQGWYAVTSDKDVISTKEVEAEVIISEITNDRANVVTLRANLIGSKFVVGNLKLKLFKLLAWVKGEEYSGTFIISMECDKTCDKQIDTLKLFATNNMASLTSFISPN